MKHHEKDSYGLSIVKVKDNSCTQLTGTATLIGEKVFNQKQETLGNINDVMLDTDTGKICYFVLSYGGFMGMGEKLLAIPWQALIINKNNNSCMLNVDSAKLLSAPGFDKNNWPNMADEKWANTIHSFYGTHLKRSDSMHSGM